MLQHVCEQGLGAEGSRRVPAAGTAAPPLRRARAAPTLAPGASCHTLAAWQEAGSPLPQESHQSPAAAWTLSEGWEKFCSTRQLQAGQSADLAVLRKESHGAWLLFRHDLLPALTSSVSRLPRPCQPRLMLLI